MINEKKEKKMRVRKNTRIIQDLNNDDNRHTHSLLHTIYTMTYCLYTTSINLILKLLHRISLLKDHTTSHQLFIPLPDASK